VILLHATGIGGRPASAQGTPANFKVAFIGDQGLGSSSTAVLQLIENEGAEAVLHLGDFDYADNPQAWESQINAVLGSNFPYFAVAGNHDESEFYGAGGYQERIEARMNRLGISWQGDLGAQSTFKYAGIFFVLTAPGVFGSGNGFHDVYIRDRLAADNSIWRICGWHKDQRLMQVGGKSDETGWGVYEQARRGGAIIATGHEHSYSRTHLLSDMDNQIVASTSGTLRLARDLPGTGPDEGRSFAFVSGLGGESIRDQELDGPWWAAIYTSDQGANYGALFGEFNYLGNPRRARFYFKDIDGFVADEFFVEVPETGSPGTTLPTTTTTLLTPTTTLVAPTTTLPSSDGIVAEEVRTGGAIASVSVQTSSNLAAVAGSVYLAAVSPKPNRTVLSVSGLGLTWSEVVAQCAGRNQTGVSVWIGQGIPTQAGRVTATLAAAPDNAVIAVTRYAGVDADAPLGDLVSANTNGAAGACTGGIDGSGYALQLLTDEPGDLIYVAAAMRQWSHTAGGGFIERAEVAIGDAGLTASVATADRAISAATTVTAQGTFNGTVDWAAAAFALRPAAGASVPTNKPFTIRALKLSHLGDAAGQQGYSLGSDDLDTTGTSYDPMAEGLRLTLRTGSTLLTSAVIPAADPRWQRSRGGYRWRARAGEGPGGLTRVKLRASARTLRANFKASTLNLASAAGASTFDVTLSVGNDLWSGATASCSSSVSGGTKRCQ
jgi:predicted phosphodiesterase